MSWFTEGRSEWLELEQLKTNARRADATCWKCGASATEALCDDCERRRLHLMQRFGGRAGSNNPNQRFGPTKSKPRDEWMPFKDSV